MDSDTQVAGANANPAMLADGSKDTAANAPYTNGAASVVQPSRCNSGLTSSVATSESMTPYTCTTVMDAKIATAGTRSEAADVLRQYGEIIKQLSNMRTVIGEVGNE